MTVRAALHVLPTVWVSLVWNAPEVAPAKGDVVVPKQRSRAHLADPIMAFDEDPLEARSRQKFHSTREGAAGGNGEAAGGGCIATS